MACSSSGLKSRAGDAGDASGNQVGSSIISGTSGGTGGTIGPGGAGGVSIGGDGGTIGSGGTGGASTGGTGGQGGAAGANTGGTAGTISPGGAGGASIGGSGGISVTDASVDASGKPEPDSSSPRVGAPHPQPCLAGEFLNSGKECSGPPDGEGESCQLTGDGWCYTQCEQDSNCAGGFVCTMIYTFDVSILPIQYSVCDGPIGAPLGGACRFDNDCDAGASCVTNTHCGDASVCSVCQN
jgi:hypothetical protein